MNPHTELLTTEESLNDFLESFERGTWPKSAWTHAAHIAVAACYLIENRGEDAAGRMRRGIVHYNQCVGTINSDHSGYHETITLFWLAVGWRLYACSYRSFRGSEIRSANTTASTSWDRLKRAGRGLHPIRSPCLDSVLPRSMPKGSVLASGTCFFHFCKKKFPTNIASIPDE